MKILEGSMLFLTTAMLTVGACASTPPPAPLPADSAQASVSTTHGVPGGMSVEVATAESTVTAIDHSKREVTLLQADGSKVAILCGPEVRNFDQIKVGDRVKAKVESRLEVFVRAGDGTNHEGLTASSATAAKGAKPGIVSTTTAQVTGRIVKLDTVARTATLQYADGSRETFPVRADVDMSSANIGDEVVMRATEIRSIVVETP
jgi:hypothetical protein